MVSIISTCSMELHPGVFSLSHTPRVKILAGCIKASRNSTPDFLRAVAVSRTGERVASEAVDLAGQDHDIVELTGLRRPRRAADCCERVGIAEVHVGIGRIPIHVPWVIKIGRESHLIYSVNLVGNVGALDDILGIRRRRAGRWKIGRAHV